MKPYRLQQIDESILSEYSCLKPTDYCYFLGEYGGRQKSQHSEINNLIINLKKPMDRKDLPEWRYKQRAIVDAAYLLASTSSWHKLKECTWIPIPPCKAKSDPGYDGFDAYSTKT